MRFTIREIQIVYNFLYTTISQQRSITVSIMTVLNHINRPLLWQQSILTVSGPPIVCDKSARFFITEQYNSCEAIETDL